MIFEIREAGHVGDYLIAYPAEEYPQTVPAVFTVKWHEADDIVDQRHLAWLLAQPDLPDEFRRAAAVHLKPGRS